MTPKEIHERSMAEGREIVRRKLAQAAQEKQRRAQAKSVASARYFERCASGGRNVHKFSSLGVVQRNQFDLTGSGPIPNVSLISLGEAKGHGVYVDKVCLQQVLARLRQLGDVKVKVDRGSGTMSTVGYMDNFSMSTDGTKVIGNLHIYDSEPNKPRILEIAQKKPHHMGMSLEFEGVDQTLNGKTFARCSDISAVALVSDPAANKSLFAAAY
jgi:hypothetical protein